MDSRAGAPAIARPEAEADHDIADRVDAAYPLVEVVTPSSHALPRHDDHPTQNGSDQNGFARTVVDNESTESTAPDRADDVSHGIQPDALDDNAASAADDLVDPAMPDPQTATDLPAANPARPRLRGMARLEAWLETLAHRYAFIRKITSRLFLPIAFHSGLMMKKLDPHTFTYVLPFRRFNRNFYDAMAGAALVANSEIAAGMYLFGELGGRWTIVCKNINYRFLRPCLGPAIYKVKPLEDLKAKLLTGQEFNIDLALEILQQVSGQRRHPRVGRCEVTFHCTPKGPHGNRGLRRRLNDRAGQKARET